jgi:hypothetical protein
VLLPVEIAVRRVRTTPADIWAWLRHPHRIALEAPRWSAALPSQSPAWLPGAWRQKRRPAPPPLTWPTRTPEPSRGSVTPGLARQSAEVQDEGEDDALGAAMKWLAARRSTTGDRG